MRLLAHWTDEQQQRYRRNASQHRHLCDLAGIPEAYRHCTSENWRGGWPNVGLDGRPIELDKWPNERQWCVTIIGKVGSGKTHLATALLVELMRRDWQARWFDCHLAIKAMQAEMGTEDDGRTLARMLDGCWYPDPTRGSIDAPAVLLLDDVGSERPTDYALDQIATVLRARHGRRRPTILTSNAESLETLGKHLDGRLSSRLQEGIVLELDAPDQRAAKTAEATA